MPGGTDRLLVRILLLFPSGRGAGFRNVAGAGCGVVFGTLLGPETTGPGVLRLFGCGVFRVLCFWFPGAADHARVALCGWCVWGVVYGVVV